MPVLLQLIPLLLLLLALVRRCYPGERLIERVRRRRRAQVRRTRSALPGGRADVLARVTCLLAWDLGARAPPGAAAPQLTS